MNLLIIMKSIMFIYLQINAYDDIIPRNKRKNSLNLALFNVYLSNITIVNLKDHASHTPYNP